MKVDIYIYAIFSSVILINNFPFKGILSDNADSPTPPTSPSRILKENDNQWLNSEVVDFSLSSLLGQLESPIKNQPQAVISSIDDSRLVLPQDVRFFKLKRKVLDR